MTTSDPRSILAEVRWSDDYLERARKKILTPEEIRRASPDDTIILTKGVFDVLHSGHLALFALMGELRRATSGLSVVAVATDNVVRVKKGNARPFLSFAERNLQVAIHPDIDFVVADGSAGLGPLISALRPAVYVKGQDTALNPTPDSSDIPKQTTVTLQESRNPEIPALSDCQAKVIVFRDTGTMSTSELVRRIGKSAKGDRMTDFVEQYKRMREDYEELTKEVSRIVTKLAGQGSPVVLSHITSRTKDPDGVKEKIERKGYTNPSVQMEDLAGVRAIVYRRQDIAELDGRISMHFDLAGGDDKTAEMGDASMGYGGVHLVVRLKKGMVSDRENLLNLKCEVQIRTVLQDAWSVIGHPLAYKSEVHLPLPLRRRFNTLSALLEVVDESFEDILETRERIAKDLKQAPALLYKSDINDDSLTAFCEKRYPDLEINPHWLDFIIENVHAGKTIKTIGDIARALDRATAKIEAYRDQRPDLFKYSTDYVTKALGWTDPDFRNRHPFSEATRQQFARDPLPDA